ncbi:hypothetical protein U3516DRAFT_914333 [Neocallimastix sp. 'constans']
MNISNLSGKFLASIIVANFLLIGFKLLPESNIINASKNPISSESYHVGVSICLLSTSLTLSLVIVMNILVYFISSTGQFI